MEREEPVAVLTARVDNLQREDPIMEWTDRSRLSTQTKLEGRTLGCVYDAAHFYRGRHKSGPHGLVNYFPAVA